jgi:hypothetical protein
MGDVDDSVGHIEVFLPVVDQQALGRGPVVLARDSVLVLDARATE